MFSLRALRKEVYGTGAAAAAGNDRLVTLTKARQQTNTPNTHKLSLLLPSLSLARGVVWHIVSELSLEVGFF